MREHRSSSIAGPDDSTIAALLLAAGSSRRFGERNKLFAELDGRTLLVHAMNCLAGSQVSCVVVVTGYQAERVSQLVQSSSLAQDKPVRLVHNADHASGLASSLGAGIRAFGHARPDALVVTLADMPYVGYEVIDELIATYIARPGNALYVPVYRGRRGNPVLIAASVFDRLLGLDGDCGARVIAAESPQLVCEVPCDTPGILVDIDSPDML